MKMILLKLDQKCMKNAAKTFAHVLESPHGRPAQALPGLRAIRIAHGHVTFATGPDLERQIKPTSFLKVFAYIVRMRLIVDSFDPPP